MSTKEELTVREYFGELIAPNVSYASQLEKYTATYDKILTSRWYDFDELGCNHIIVDFITFANDYLSNPNPICAGELLEVAHNITDEFVEEAEDLVLRAYNLELAKSYSVESLQELPFDAQIHDCLNVEIGVGQAMLNEHLEDQIDAMRQLAIARSEQIAQFQGWLHSDEGKVFFRCYDYMRLNNIRKSNVMARTHHAIS